MPQSITVGRWPFNGRRAIVPSKWPIISAFPLFGHRLRMAINWRGGKNGSLAVRKFGPRLKCQIECFHHHLMQPIAFRWCKKSCNKLRELQNLPEKAS
ncbi:hypothetical protein AB6A40_006649 [Gnathostoma spinigerum]|uniref:Uncharacterized protein n=1 Tax=Gnathostoma spinigerum TaxID=75299 RepID=A0ABD6EIY5_9BILA